MTEVVSQERAENPKQTYYTPVYSPKTDTNRLSPLTFSIKGIDSEFNFIKNR